jgi:hypothetical protein
MKHREQGALKKRLTMEAESAIVALTIKSEEAHKR